MSSFEDYFFKIPISKNYESDWNELIENSDDDIKLLRIFQSRVCLLVNDLTDLSVTPERIAWFSIWTRTFQILDSVIIMGENLFFDYPLDILSRVAIEAELQILSIFEPLNIHYKFSDPSFPFPTRISKGSEENAWNKVLERLCAYSAYCLYNDKQGLNEKIQPKHMNAVWDPKPVNDIISKPETYKQHTALFGPLESQIDIHTNIELEKMKEKQSNYYKNQIERITLWLNHPDLKFWHQKLKKNPTMNFFTLISTEEIKMRRLLKNMNLEMGILSYGDQSRLIHNSTLESFYSVNDNLVIMKIIQDENKIKRDAFSIANSCNIMGFFLSLFKSRLWC